MMGQKFLRKLISCNYTGQRMLDFIHFQHKHRSMPRSRALARENGCDDDDLERRVERCKNATLNMPVSSAQWENVCKKHSIHVYKVLRLHVVDILPLLNSPGYNIKILYMIRDPRGILTSRMKIGWQKLTDKSDFPLKLCYDMMDNYDSVLRLKLPSDKLKIVKYEAVTNDPIKMTKELFEYAGLSYTETTEEYLKKNALGDGNFTRKETIMGTYRRNSNMTANAWKDKLTKSQILMIEKQCGEFLDRAGYEFIYLKNKSYMSLLRNINVLPGTM